MLIFRKSMSIILGCSLLSLSLPVLALDNDVPTRNFGTPYGSLRYDMRNDNDLQVKNTPAGGEAGCQTKIHNICWVQKLPSASKY